MILPIDYDLLVPGRGRSDRNLCHCILFFQRVKWQILPECADSTFSLITLCILIIFKFIFCVNDLLQFFSVQDLTIIPVIPFQQSRCIQAIRTPGAAPSAMEAAFYALHLLLRLRRQMGCRRRTTDHQAHAGTIIDFDPCRTRHAVSAASAEFSTQLFPVLFNNCR